ncbi:MAG TPA: hypothetical protein VHX66_05440 [Solirubrobacteraceae bacterium]|jgi:hypothetical protein|nr:hypothetical protein [Solirubrobacteraceae bacterium]
MGRTLIGALVAAGACVVVALGAYGNGGTGESDVPPAHAFDAVGSLPLTKRVLRSGDLAMMVRTSPPTVTAGADAWAAGEGLQPGAIANEADRLRALGFDEGVDENLKTRGNGDRYGLSLVERFSSAGAAKAELDHVAGRGAGWTYFTVTGIPGARGFESSRGRYGGRNVAFTDGKFYYLVGAGWSRRKAADKVPRAGVIAAARLLYGRVHGHAIL